MIPSSAVDLVTLFDEGEGVEFYLTYEGPVPANAAGSKVLEVKHDIRRALHPQLLDLCARHPAYSNLIEMIRGRKESPPPIGHLRDPDWAAIGAKYRLGNFEFVPLIVGAMLAACHIDVLFLRREKPGSLITKPYDEYGGDLDNRVKILLDALRVPREAKEIPKNAQPDSTETPFYCLLEDDSLITKLQVEAATLLGPPTPDRQKDVRLVIRVTTKLMVSTFYNMEFGI